MSDSFMASASRWIVRVDDLTVDPLPHSEWACGVKSFSARFFTGCLYAFLSNAPSPILRGIAGVDSLSAGRVHWRRPLLSRLRGVNDPAPIAYIPRHPRLTYGMSVRDTLLLPLASCGKEIDADAYESIVGVLGLVDVLDTDIADLDAARVLCVEIARSLMLGARIVMVEEPTDQLSEQGAHVVMSALKALTQSGFCVIFQTRSPEVASQAQKVFLLMDGAAVGVFDAADASMLKAEYSASLPAPSDSVSSVPLTAVQGAEQEPADEEFRLTPVRSSLDPSMRQAQARAWGLTLRHDDEEDDVIEEEDALEDLRPRWQPTRQAEEALLTPLPSALPSVAPVVEPVEGGSSMEVEDDVELAPLMPSSRLDPVSTLDSGDAVTPDSLPFPLADPDAVNDPSPITTVLPRIPRPSVDTSVEASPEVISAAKEILKDLPGSVLPQGDK